MIKETEKAFCQDNLAKNTDMKLSKKEETKNNRFSCLSGLEDNNEDEKGECSLSLEQLKLIKGNHRTKAQQKKYRKLMRLRIIETQTDSLKEENIERNRERVTRFRERESLEEKENRRDNDRAAKVKSKDKETPEEKEIRQAKNREANAKSKEEKTTEGNGKRQAKNSK